MQNALQTSSTETSAELLLAAEGPARLFLAWDILRYFVFLKRKSKRVLVYTMKELAVLGYYYISKMQ